MIIEGRELNLIYDMNTEEETYALRNVNIILENRGMTGLMGPSGSGKSSLLYVLAGLKKTTSGTVYFDDADTESLQPAVIDSIRRSKFGFIFQRHSLISYLSALDNVLVGLNKHDGASAAKAMALLEKFKIAHLANKKPYQLSVGQRQRIAVARAMINDPSVIFADEPTASLDHRNAAEVMGVLEEFKEHASILVVTHDLTILHNADRIIELWDGKIVRSQLMQIGP